MDPCEFTHFDVNVSKDLPMTKGRMKAMSFLKSDPAHQYHRNRVCSGAVVLSCPDPRRLYLRKLRSTHGNLRAYPVMSKHASPENCSWDSSRWKKLAVARHQRKTAFGVCVGSFIKLGMSLLDRTTYC